MSNDDREQPRWGERLPEPSQRGDAGAASRPEPGHDQDEPAYGERAYGEQGQQAYGQQSQGQQAHGQQYGGQGQQPQQQNQPQQNQQQQNHGQPQHFGAAPGYGQTAPWDQQHDGGQTKQRRTLGVVALVAGLIALVLGIVGGVVFGNAIAAIPGLADAARTGSTDSSQLQQSMQDEPSAYGPIVVAVVLGAIGTGFGLWAIIQGIIAAVKARGRAFGIIAIVLAVLGPIAYVIIYITVAASSVV